MENETNCRECGEHMFFEDWMEYDLCARCTAEEEEAYDVAVMAREEDEIHEFGKETEQEQYD